MSKPTFRNLVYSAVCDVPSGRVTTYGDVATAIGAPNAARQVGFALAALTPERAETVPWHRVINAQGRISLRGDMVRGALQRSKLIAEGIGFDNRDRVDLPALRWHYPEWIDTDDLGVHRD